MKNAILRLGSKDRSGDDSVSLLQALLTRVGVIQPKEPFTRGTFDQTTDLGVRRLQWFAGNVPGALALGGKFVPRSLTHLIVDGLVGTHMNLFLEHLISADWIATGSLVKVNFGAFNRINANTGFKAVLDQNRSVGLCDRGFAEVLVGMNDAASQHNVYIFINQLFRVDGAPVSGALVTPKHFSAHLIGRAVDLQLGTSFNIPQHANKIKAAAAETAFGKFREHAKKHLHCRYGGDFAETDPPHFDRQILPGGSHIWKFYHFFNQLQYRQALVNTAAIPSASL